MIDTPRSFRIHVSDMKPAPVYKGDGSLEMGIPFVIKGEKPVFARLAYGER